MNKIKIIVILFAFINASLPVNIYGQYCLAPPGLNQAENKLFKQSNNPTKVFLTFFSNIRDKSKVDNPLSITTLGGALEYAYNEEIDVKLSHYLVDGGVEGVIKRIRDEKPEILGLSLGFGSLEELYAVMEYIESLPVTERPLVILGNIVASYNARFILERYPEVLICVGLGEDTMLDVVKYKRGEISKSEIQSIVYFHEGELVQNKLSRNTLKNAHAPLPAFLPDVVKSGGVAYMETSRGCPFNCAMCDRKTFLGGGWEGRDIDEVIDDVVEACKLGVRNINFVDEDLFAGGTDRVVELAERLIELKNKGVIPKDLIFGTSTSTRNIYRKKDTDINNKHRLSAFQALYDAGLRVLFVGIESGSPAQLKRYGKAATIEENEIALGLIEKIGIYNVPGFIMLDPKITVSEIRENIEFLRRTGMDRQITYPLKTYIPLARSRYVDQMMSENLVDRDSYIPERIAYEYYFENENVADILNEIKDWEDSQAMFFWELKIIFRSSKFGDLTQEERALFRDLINEQTLILLDYFDDLVTLSADKGSESSRFSELSEQYGNRLIKDMISFLQYIQEGRITISIKELQGIVYEGIAREVIRLHFKDRKFTLEDIASKVYSNFDFNLDMTKLDDTINIFVSEKRLAHGTDGKYECTDNFNAYRNIPWPDLPRPVRKEIGVGTVDTAL